MSLVAIAVGAIPSYLISRPGGMRENDVPKMLLEGGTFIDLGAARAGQSLKHAMRVRNVGGAELRARVRNISCGCLVASAGSSDIRVSPGGAVEVRLSIDTTSREGEVVQTFDLESNDPASLSLRVRVRAKAEVPFRIGDARASVGEVGLGAKAVASLALRSEVSPSAWHVVGVRSLAASPVSLANWSECSDETTRTKVLRLDVVAPLELGDFSGEFSVSTDCRDRPTFDMRVVGRTRGNFRVLPPRLAFGLVRSGRAPLEASLAIDALDEIPTLDGSHFEDAAGRVVQGLWRVAESRATARRWEGLVTEVLPRSGDGDVGTLVLRFGSDLIRVPLSRSRVTSSAGSVDR